jgi:hypothetical protein
MHAFGHTGVHVCTTMYAHVHMCVHAGINIVHCSFIFAYVCACVFAPICKKGDGKPTCHIFSSLPYQDLRFGES